MNSSISKPSVPKQSYYHRQLLIKPLKCPDCRNCSNIQEDYKSGHTCCTRCGLVLEHQIISTEAEWRSFSNDDKSGPDPNRIGSSCTNIYLSDIYTMDTSIGTMGNMNNLKNTQNKLIHGSQSTYDKKMKNGITNIEKYGSRLNVTRDAKNYSCELFKELMTRREMNGKKALNIVTACMHIACNNLNCHRSLEYLCHELTVDKKRIKKILTSIHKLKAANLISLPIVRKGKGFINKTIGEILTVKYGNELRLNKNVIKNLILIARKIASLHILDGKKPQTIAAVTIYLTCIVNGDETQQRCFKEISAVAKISEHTIKKVFREYLLLRIKLLLPKGYGDANIIATLTRH